jgi:hypothetical protein
MGVNRLFGLAEPGDSLETLVSQINKVGAVMSKEYSHPSLPQRMSKYLQSIHINIMRHEGETQEALAKRKFEFLFTQLRNVFVDIAIVRPNGLYEALVKCLSHSTALTEPVRKLFTHNKPEVVMFGTQLLSENRDDELFQFMFDHHNANELLEDRLRDRGFCLGNRPSQR